MTKEEYIEWLEDYILKCDEQDMPLEQWALIQALKKARTLKTQTDE